MPGVPRVATRDTVIDDGEEEEESGGGAQKKMKKILEGQMVFVATSKAAMDPKAFPEPEKLDPYRPLSSYILLGHVSVFFPLPSLFFLSFFSRKGDSTGPSFLLRSSTRRTCSRGNFERSFQIEKSSTRGGA